MPRQTLAALAWVLPLSSCAPTDHRLPLTMAEGHTPLVELRINGTLSREFVLDTGASGTTILPADAERLRLPEAGKELGVGSTGSIGIRLYRASELRSRSFVVRDITLAALQGPSFEGRNVTGLAGVNLFPARMVTFDLPGGHVIFHRPGRRPGKRWVVQKSEWIQPWKIMVPVSVNGVPAMGFLDTGAQHSVANRALARLAGTTPDPLAEATGIAGISGQDVAMEFSRQNNIMLGTRQLGVRPVHVADLPVFARLLGPEVPQLMVGMDMLKDLRFSIDYRERKVYFEQ